MSTTVANKSPILVSPQGEEFFSGSAIWAAHDRETISEISAAFKQHDHSCNLKAMQASARSIENACALVRRAARDAESSAHMPLFRHVGKEPNSLQPAASEFSVTLSVRLIGTQSTSV